MTRILLSAGAGFVLSVLAGLLLLPVLRALKAGQSIREVGPTWHNYKAGTPVMGGLMFISSVLVCLLLNIPLTNDHTVFLIFGMAAFFGAIGFLDDYCKVRHKRNLGLTAKQKSALQMAVSALFLYVMYRTGRMNMDLFIPFTTIRLQIHPLIYIFFAMFVVVGCVNAVNLTDGVDGLCTCVTIPVMIFFALASLALRRWSLAVLPGALAGSLLAYLFFNWHPAKVFMGDTGSLFLGGLVCGMAFALDIPLVLLMVGFVYIVETLSVILQVSYFKATHGKRIFKMAPIHHHFEMCGWKEEKIVLSFTAVSALMCLLAWLSIGKII